MPQPTAAKPKEMPEVIVAANDCYETRDSLNLAILTLSVLDPRHISLRALIVAYSAVNEAIAALEDGNLTL